MEEEISKLDPTETLDLLRKMLETVTTEFPETKLFHNEYFKYARGKMSNELMKYAKSDDVDQFMLCMYEALAELEGFIAGFLPGEGHSKEEIENLADVHFQKFGEIKMPKFWKSLGEQGAGIK